MPSSRLKASVFRAAKASPVCGIWIVRAGRKFINWDMLERKGFRGPGHLVSFADWMPGTARAPVSLSHHSYED